MSVEPTTLERSALERKDREELTTIAQALGGKPPSRARKAEIVQLILELTGVEKPGGTERAAGRRARGHAPGRPTAEATPHDAFAARARRRLRRSVRRRRRGRRRRRRAAGELGARVRRHDRRRRQPVRRQRRRRRHRRRATCPTRGGKSANGDTSPAQKASGAPKGGDRAESRQADRGQGGAGRSGGQGGQGSPQGQGTAGPGVTTGPGRRLGRTRAARATTRATATRRATAGAGGAAAAARKATRPRAARSSRASR